MGKIRYDQDKSNILFFIKAAIHVKLLMWHLITRLSILWKLKVTCHLGRISSNQCWLQSDFNVQKSNLGKGKKPYQRIMTFWRASSVKVVSQLYYLSVTLRAKHIIKDKALNKTSSKETHKAEKPNFKNKSPTWSKKHLKKRRKMRKKIKKRWSKNLRIRRNWFRI